MSRKTWLEEPHQRFDDYKLRYNFSKLTFIDFFSSINCGRNF